MNLDLAASGGAVLVVSQFTLHADTSRGHRPSFIRAAPPELASDLYEAFVAALRELGLRVETGTFGAHMAVDLVNDGPVTLVLTSAEPGLARRRRIAARISPRGVPGAPPAARPHRRHPNSAGVRADGRRCLQATGTAGL